MGHNNKGPERTCIGCRAKKNLSELMRYGLIVNRNGVIQTIPDAKKRLPGRGAWLCLGNNNCFLAAVKKKAFNRAFRREVLIETPLMTEENGEAK